MKRILLVFISVLMLTIPAKGMSYEQAREQALFLTDKMAYELNLTDAQYEAAYEINLDYFMGVTSYDDVFGVYWRQRNFDLQCVLLDWQWRSYLDCLYFYRPLYWGDGYWHFRIYARYPHRDYYFFGCPRFYAEYHGGHSWRYNGGRSWYSGRERDYRDYRRGDGMHSRFDNGDYGRGVSFGNARGTRSGIPSFGTRDMAQDNTTNRGGTPRRSTQGSFGSRSYGGNVPQSSTRETVRRGNDGTTYGFGSRGGVTQQPSGTFSPRRSAPSGGGFGSRSGGGSHGNGGFGGGNSGGGTGGGHFGHR